MLIVASHRKTNVPSQYLRATIFAVREKISLGGYDFTVSYAAQDHL
jgi:hypothetical protein